MDEVWVPSWFCREAFVRSGLSPTKVIVIPHGVDLDLYDPAMTQPLEIPGAHGTIYLSIFEWSLRKGWDVLLDAWHRALPKPMT
jgi:glycosyltransferase involved in cell wall biosynthesis